jgi:hypothetical protein
VNPGEVIAARPVAMDNIVSTGILKPKYAIPLGLAI